MTEFSDASMRTLLIAEKPFGNVDRADTIM
jgi:hypothetical protein